MRIGDPDAYVNGEKTYVLNYKVNLGDDRIAERDMFYYNVLGDQWDTSINNFTCEINFPKTTDFSNIKVYTGVLGFTVTNQATVTELSDTNAPFNCITIYNEMLEGYFTIDRPSATKDLPILIGFMVGLLIICLIFYKKYKPREIVPTVEFEAPKGVTPAEAGYIIDKKMDKSEIASLIVYWANKGFINIKDGKKVELQKIKDSDKSFKGFEKEIFDTLFKNNEKFTFDGTNYELAVAVQNAKKQIKEKQNKVCFDNK